MDWTLRLMDLMFIAGQVSASLAMAYGAYLAWDQQRWAKRAAAEGIADGFAPGSHRGRRVE